MPPLALIVPVAALLGLVIWSVANLTRRQRRNTDALEHAKDDLAEQVDARAAELHDANARLRSIIDSAVDGIIVIDTSGTIESFNRGAERLFGYPASEVMGRNVSMLMPSPDHENHDGYLERYLTTGAAKVIGIGRQLTGRRRDGTTVPVHLSVGEMWIKGERKFTGMLHDLSARMRLDAELRARATARGSAEIRNYITTLEAVIDVSALQAGDYQLALKRTGGEWQMFPLRVR